MRLGKKTLNKSVEVHNIYCASRESNLQCQQAPLQQLRFSRKKILTILENKNLGGNPPKECDWHWVLIFFCFFPHVSLFWGLRKNSYGLIVLRLGSGSAISFNGWSIMRRKDLWVIYVHQWKSRRVDDISSSDPTAEEQELSVPVVRQTYSAHHHLTVHLFGAKWLRILTCNYNFGYCPCTL